MPSSPDADRGSSEGASGKFESPDESLLEVFRFYARPRVGQSLSRIIRHLDCAKRPI